MKKTLEYKPYAWFIIIWLACTLFWLPLTFENIWRQILIYCLIQWLFIWRLVCRIKNNRKYKRWDIEEEVEKVDGNKEKKQRLIKVICRICVILIILSLIVWISVSWSWDDIWWILLIIISLLWKLLWWLWDNIWAVIWILFVWWFYVLWKNIQNLWDKTIELEKDSLLSGWSKDEQISHLRHRIYELEEKVEKLEKKSKSNKVTKK